MISISWTIDCWDLIRFNSFDFLMFLFFFFDAAVDFFNLINMIWGVVAEFCTKDTCPVMTAGTKYCVLLFDVEQKRNPSFWKHPFHRYEYHWADGSNKKPIKVSAPDYVDHLFQWVQKQLDDETIFPSKIGVPFPKDFDAIVKNIFKRLFRVYEFGFCWFCFFFSFKTSSGMLTSIILIWGNSQHLVQTHI